jgi:hypothetical protein
MFVEAFADYKLQFLLHCSIPHADITYFKVMKLYLLENRVEHCVMGLTEEIIILEINNCGIISCYNASHVTKEAPSKINIF